jgi:hypothetical protein
MLGWVPGFEKILIMGSSIETLNIARILRLCKFAGIINIMTGEKNLQWPYDRERFMEDLSYI